jgi:thioredoxin-related protein
LAIAKKIPSMKKYLLLLLFCGLFSAAEAQSSEVNWISFEEAIAKNEKEPRKILIDFYTVWCGPCRMMNSKTFKNPVIAKYINENYYAVKFNAEGNDSVNFRGHTFYNPNYDPKRARSRNSTHQLTGAMASVQGRIAYPTVVYLNEKMEIITPVQGFIGAPDMEPILHFVAEDAWTEQEFQEYKKAFKGEL